MKKLLPFLLFCLPFWSANLSAQVPQLVNYQGLALDNSGNPIISQTIGLQLSVLQNSVSGAVEYVETQQPTTNAMGVFNIQIGNGSPVQGLFKDVNWAAGSKFLKVEMDAAGGSNYQLVGTSQLVSVPYALYAERVNPANLPNAFNFGLRVPNTVGIAELGKGAGFNYETFWFGGEEEILNFSIENLPPKVFTDASGGLNTKFSAAIGKLGSFGIWAACDAALGEYNFQLRVRSDKTQREQVKNLTLKIIAPPNLPVFSGLTFFQYASTTSCFQDPTATNVPPPNPASVVQDVSDPQKVWLYGLKYGVYLTNFPTGNEGAIYAIGDFHFTFNQPADICGNDGVPINIPLQPIACGVQNTPFGIAINPPAATGTIVGTGFLKPTNGDYSKPIINITSATVTLGSEVCTKFTAVVHP